MFVPKKRSKRAGVTKIPKMLPITALHKAVATFPPAELVNKIHIFTVVGRHVKISKPSNKVDGNKLGQSFLNNCTNGIPANNGHAKNDNPCVNAFNFIFAKASVNSDNSKDNPDIKKINMTPYFPINNSGFSIPPDFPSYNIKKALKQMHIIPPSKRPKNRLLKFFDATKTID